jgi:hypothetical protein
MQRDTQRDTQHDTQKPSASTGSGPGLAHAKDSLGTAQMDYVMGDEECVNEGPNYSNVGTAAAGHSRRGKGHVGCNGVGMAGAGGVSMTASQLQSSIRRNDSARVEEIIRCMEVVHFSKPAEQMATAWLLMYPRCG